MKFPVFSQLTGNFDSETGSLETAPSSGESRANLTSSIRAPKLRRATACSLASLRQSVRHADFAGRASPLRKMAFGIRSCSRRWDLFRVVRWRLRQVERRLVERRDCAAQVCGNSNISPRSYAPSVNET